MKWRLLLASDHNCNQGPRFDSLEEAIKGIHETLKQLTDLLISKAESDTKLTGTYRCLSYAHNNAGAAGYPVTRYQKISMT